MKSGFVALILIAALLGGGLSHATISHTHGGHSHGAEESSIWTSLHSSLRHEDKKPLFALLEVGILVTSLLSIALVTLSYGFSRAISLRSLATLAIVRTPLRRGIHKYRAFA